MCNLIPPFINKKRSYYVDWVSSRAPGPGRFNLTAKKKNVSFIIRATILSSCLFICLGLGFFFLKLFFFHVAQLPAVRRASARKQPRLNRNFMHKSTIQRIVSGSPAPVLPPTVRSRTKIRQTGFLWSWFGRERETLMNSLRLYRKPETLTPSLAGQRALLGGVCSQ